MSTLCRAYSITEYGSSSNRIRNIYKKYLNYYSEDKLRSAISEIVQSNPMGVYDEYPFFENRLKQLLEQDGILDETDFSSYSSNTYSSGNTYRNDEFYDDNSYYKNSNSVNDNNSSFDFSSILSDKNKVILIVAVIAVLLVIIFHKQIFGFIGMLIPYVLGAVVIYLVLKVLIKSNKGKKSRSKSSFKMPKLHISGRNVIIAVIWAAVFLYAAFYYSSAGNPFWWTILAAAIGIIGGIAIAVR